MSMSALNNGGGASTSSSPSGTSAAKAIDHDEDAEACLVSCAIGNRVRVIDLDGMPSPGDFYDGLHRSVYTAALDVVTEKGRQDPRLLVARLRSQGINPSPEYWADVRARAAQPEFVAEYAEIVRTLALKRRVRDFGQLLVQAASRPGGDRNELLGLVDRSVEEVYAASGGAARSSDLVSLQDAIDAAWHQLHNPEEMRRRTVCFGIRGIDDAIGGVGPGKIITIAAPPGGGKTSLELGLVLHSAVNQSIRWLLVSKEMTPTQLAEQMLYMRAGVDGKIIRLGKSLTKAQWSRMHAARAELMALSAPDGTPHIKIVPPKGLSARAVASIIRREHAVHGLGAFAVDYLQILDWPDDEFDTSVRGGGGGGASRRRRQQSAETMEQRIAQDAQMFKDLAEQCGIAGVLLSQYNRGDQRHGAKGEPIPSLNSLKGSGGIAAASDMVCALHCALTQEQMADESKAGRALPVTAYFLKGRFTGQGSVPLDFETRFTRFVDRGEANDPDAQASFEKGKGWSPYVDGSNAGEEEDGGDDRDNH